MVQLRQHQGVSGFAESLEGAKQGVEWAWEAIYHELAGVVTGYLRSRGAPDPEDLAGEVFLQVARDIHRFQGDQDAFRSWVFVIAHRRLIDARRAAKRRPQETDSELPEETIPAGNVEEEAIEHLTFSWIADILDILSDDQREVLALRVIADLTLAQTAEIMGKRVGAIKALQRRALASIRSQIEKGRVTL